MEYQWGYLECMEGVKQRFYRITQYPGFFDLTVILAYGTEEDPPCTQGYPRRMTGATRLWSKLRTPQRKGSGGYGAGTGSAIGVSCDGA